MHKIVKETESIFCSFDDIMPHIIISEKKTKRRMAWKADLEIGSQIRVKIAAYIYVRCRVMLQFLQSILIWPIVFIVSSCAMRMSYQSGQ